MIHILESCVCMISIIGITSLIVCINNESVTPQGEVPE